MKTDPTFHTVNFDGRSFGVSAYPFGPNAAGGKFWSVRTTDGSWHVVCERTSNLADDWRRAEAAIIEWLTDFYRV